MTWCEPQLVQFNEKIALDPARRERIAGAIKRLEEFCEKDAELSAARDGEIFLQGSVATQTVVKPLAGDEFDVDVVYSFRLEAFPKGTSPTQIVAWFLG